MELGNKIKERGLQIDKILCSPLIRARETAQHIADATGIPLEIEPRLTEQNFGKYEGTARNGTEFLQSKSHFADSYEGGESMLRLAQRIYNLLDELKAEKANRNASENLSANEQDEMQQTVNSLLEEVSQLMREQQI